MPDHHLAQLYIGLPIEPLTSSGQPKFLARLEEVNALADDAPGFVWRLPVGTTVPMVQVVDRDRVVLSLNVWTSVEAFAGYLYEGGNDQLLRSRHNWFRTVKATYRVLWWLPPGQYPTIEDAQERLTDLVDNGPSPRAFTLGERYLAPDQPGPAISAG